MRLVSWNVNGIRAAHQKGFDNFFDSINADIFCIQETKMQDGQFNLTKKNYFNYINSAEKKGYSGTSIWTKYKPINVFYGINNKEFDNEGRVITIELDKFYLINVYTPNSKRDLERLEYRVSWEENFRKYILKLENHKPVIICGDLNVAHNEIDLKNPNTNRKSAGFTDEERREFTNLLELGFVDSFRYKYPDKVEYSWWSYMMKAREKNIGWRIDYFVVSDKLKNNIVDAKIHQDIFGSDHCPVSLEIEFGDEDEKK